MRGGGYEGEREEERDLEKFGKKMMAEVMGDWKEEREDKEEEGDCKTLDGFESEELQEEIEIGMQNLSVEHPVPDTSSLHEDEMKEEDELGNTNNQSLDANYTEESEDAEKSQDSRMNEPEIDTSDFSQCMDSDEYHHKVDDSNLETCLLPLASLSLEDSDAADFAHDDSGYIGKDLVAGAHVNEIDNDLEINVNLTVIQDNTISVCICARDVACVTTGRKDTDEISVVAGTDEEKDSSVGVMRGLSEGDEDSYAVHGGMKTKILKKPIRFVMRGKSDLGDIEQSSFDDSIHEDDQKFDVEAVISRSIISGSGVGIIYDPIMALHVSPEAGHVECPERITTIYSNLANNHNNSGTSIVEKCFVLKSREACDRELLLAHSQKHVKTIEDNSRAVSENGVSFGDIYFNNNTNVAARMVCCVNICSSIHMSVSYQYIHNQQFWLQ